MRSECPACGVDKVEPLLRIESTPVLCGTLWPSRAGAVAAPTGELDLYICVVCGLVYNAAFDESLMEYEGDYDISGHFSGVFRSYVDELVARLSDTYSLEGRRIIEIGCGKGEFLTALCLANNGEGIGFDRSYAGESDGVQPGVSFRREYYGAAHADEPVDFIVCRHVLEHIAEPLAFLQELRRMIGARPVTCYFEMPDARFVFSDAGIWDLIYPHVAYYGPVALRRVVTRAGFDVLATGSSFGDQYLWAVITTDPAMTAAAPPSREDDEASVHDLVDQARRAAGEYQATVATWRDELGGTADASGEVLLWGAGTKGASFLCAVGGDHVDGVVDVNPRKHGRYLPSSGVRIIGPEDVCGRTVSRVLVANPAYSEEIGRQLEQLGVATTLVAI